jgi:hypothetical protein
MMRKYLLFFSLIFTCQAFALEDNQAKLDLLAKMGVIASSDLGYHKHQLKDHQQLKKAVRDIASVDPSISPKPVIRRTNPAAVFELD